MSDVLLICGSKRRASTNRLLLEAVAAMAPAGMSCSFDDELGQLPLYDQDLDTADPPAAVARFRRAIAAADGLIIATPEYNYDLPGPLKNALDWASRPYGRASLRGKSAVVLVATPGAGSGFQCHGQLRRLLSNLENFVVPTPIVVVQRATEKLRRNADQRAEFSDPVGRRLLLANLAALDQAIAARAGEICLAGAKAMAASAPPS